MTWDAINQYSQAVENVYDDWHPPAMAWAWRRLNGIKAGPAPMFTLQMALYWSGYALLIAAALRSNVRRVAWMLILVACLPFPLAIMGSVLKDCLMQGMLLLGTGLFALSGPTRGWWARIGALIVLLLAGLLRFNAFLATLPIILALLPWTWRRTPLRFGFSTLVALVCLLAAMPLANRAIGAEESDVALSLMLFDLGGITKNTGQDAFPARFVPNQVGANARCYHPERWDFYSSWGDPPCPISFEKVDAYVAKHHINPYLAIARAALAHPLAYAEHRFAHFNLNSRFLVPNEVQGSAPDRETDNEWHFTVSRNLGLRFINEIAAASVHSPLGWPIFWIALAGGLLGLAPSLPSRATIVPIASSGLLYGLGYLPFSVSSELRYNLWTITSAAIALAFALGDLACGASVTPRRLFICFSGAIAVAILCILWRVT